MIMFLPCRCLARKTWCWTQILWPCSTISPRRPFWRYHFLPSLVKSLCSTVALSGGIINRPTVVLAVYNFHEYWLRQDPPPLEAILVIFGHRALIFFCLKALGKKWKMTPLLCACAVVITLETQKCRKRAPRSVEFNFFINCDRHKRFSQDERRRIDPQNVASDFLIFA